MFILIINMFKNLINFGCSQGQKRMGVELGPNMLFNDKTFKFKKLHCPTGNSITKSLRNLYRINSQIKGPRINVGGDHSMSIATLSHSLNTNPNVKVLWIDAHADINTPETSPSGNFHGMPLSFLTGISYHPKFDYIVNHLPFENLMYIGIRDIDSFERTLINEKNINIIGKNIIEKNDFYDIDEFIGNSPVHVSFDIDSIDPKEIKSTGTPVENGLSSDSVGKLFKMLRYKKIISLDVTEFNPKIGNNVDVYKTKYTIEKIISNII